MPICIGIFGFKAVVRSNKTNGAGGTRAGSSRKKLLQPGHGSRERVKEMLAEFADVFAKSPEDLGRTNLAKHRIDIGNAKPIRQAARRLPIHQKAEAQKEINRMLREDIIEPSSSSWSSPVVLVKKKDGSTRFCVDYRKLNAVTTKDCYPLPRIDDSLDTLAGSRWFSTLDLASGYWQVEMEEGDRPKTAFVTYSGFYQLKYYLSGYATLPLRLRD
ncbi:hypothetical protein BSL78_09607 [Apostichopus japonicus]|uniref:Reverse transcriptase domain-containing protein n=1 Tax=Stichopus japonicus TaxID=307972 RepID=A0A2G8KZR0_STIJA|nr:hypothetical protein BSL78_09607 [Apostichopus japonicus]